MALKANLHRKKKEVPHLKALKIVFGIIAFVAVAAVAFILYFNGQNVKAPLLKFLSERTDIDISCDRVEFSPIYPDVLKLYNVRVGKSSISELYVEYDLKSVISEANLNIKYLYLKDVKLDDSDLSKLKKEKFRYKQININKLDLVNSPLYLADFSTLSANLNATEVMIGNDGAMTFSTAHIVSDNARIMNRDIRKVNVNVSYDQKSVELDDLSMQVMGGTLFAKATIDPTSKTVLLKRLHLNNIIFQDYRALTGDYRFIAPNVTVNSCVLALGREDLLLGQVSGEIKDLNLSSDDISLFFTGKAGELSKPGILFTADDSNITAQISQNKVDLKLSGHIFNGRYSTWVTFDNAEDNKEKLTVHDFKLQDAKLEPITEHYEYLKKTLFAHDTLINRADISKTEFVSHIDKLPISIKEINVVVNSLQFNRDDMSITSNPFTFDFGFRSGYYSDLFIDEFSSKWKLSKDEYSIDVHKIRFNSQPVALSYTRNFARDTLDFSLKTRDFDIADLNCSMFSRLFNGKLNADISIHTAPESDLPLEKKLNGGFSIDSESLLISGFGLDLLNGGPLKDYRFNYHEFLDSISSGDCGIFNLKAAGDFENSLLKFSLSADLTTSHLHTRGEYDPSDRIIRSRASLVSLPKDSITYVNFRGHITDPLIYTSALSRGEMRPGINEEALISDADREDRVLKEIKQAAPGNTHEQTQTDDNLNENNEVVIPEEKTPVRPKGIPDSAVINTD